MPGLTPTRTEISDRFSVLGSECVQDEILILKWPLLPILPCSMPMLSLNGPQRTFFRRTAPGRSLQNTGRRCISFPRTRCGISPAKSGFTIRLPLPRYLAC